MNSMRLHWANDNEVKEVSDLIKYTDELKEYTWDGSDELPGDVVYQESLLDQGQNSERRKIGFDPDELIDEPPMITTELYPWKLEVCGDVIRLLAASGKPVITYVADPATNTLNVLFENQNIDYIPFMKRDCCRDAGESFSCTIKCRNTDDLKKCVFGFVYLTAGGYALPMENLIDMDLYDVEKAIVKSTDGVYRTAQADPAEVKEKTIALLRSALNEKKNAAGVILRFGGVRSFNLISDCLDHVSNATDPLNIDILVMANIQYSGEDPYRIDVWAY